MEVGSVGGEINSVHGGEVLKEIVLGEGLLSVDGGCESIEVPGPAVDTSEVGEDVVGEDSEVRVESA